MNAANRTTVYGVAGAVQAATAAAFGVLLVYGVVTEVQAAAWLGLAGALVNAGAVVVHQLAARHVPARVETVVNFVRAPEVDPAAEAAALERAVRAVQRRPPASPSSGLPVS